MLIGAAFTPQIALAESNPDQNTQQLMREYFKCFKAIGYSGRYSQGTILPASEKLPRMDVVLIPASFKGRPRIYMFNEEMAYSASLSDVKEQRGEYSFQFQFPGYKWEFSDASLNAQKTAFVAADEPKWANERDADVKTVHFEDDLGSFSHDVFRRGLQHSISGIPAYLERAYDDDGEGKQKGVAKYRLEGLLGPACSAVAKKDEGIAAAIQFQVFKIAKWAGLPETATLAKDYEKLWERDPFLGSCSVTAVGLK